ncbi:MAG: hypothetical protein WDW36_000090 [Sanguina aurantia]
MGIKASGLNVSIGGPAGANPADTLRLADVMLRNTTINSDIHFLSYHFYDEDHGTDTLHDVQLKALVQQHNRTDVEIFITEYNFSYMTPNAPLNSASTDAISYIGNRLTAFLGSGAAGANIFTMMAPVNDSNPGLDSLFANYTFTPKIQTFRLMSVILGLGAGQSQIMQSSYTNGSLTAAIAALNNASQPILCVTNSGNYSTSLSMIISSLLPGRVYNVAVWEASASNPTKAARQSLTVSTDSYGATSIPNILVPRKCVLGLIMHVGPQPSPPPNVPMMPAAPPTLRLPPSWPRAIGPSELAALESGMAAPTAPIPPTQVTLPLTSPPLPSTKAAPQPNKSTAAPSPAPSPTPKPAAPSQPPPLISLPRGLGPGVIGR